MDWKNHLEKNAIQKIEKTVKIKVKLPHVNKKTTTDKANFCSNTVFSLYFKIRAKKFHAAKPLAFSLHFLFRCDQNHYSNLNSKFMKMCEQILKKRQRPNTIQILWIVKNQEKANNSPSYRCAAINESKYSKQVKRSCALREIQCGLQRSFDLSSCPSKRPHRN